MNLEKLKQKTTAILKTESGRYLGIQNREVSTANYKRSVITIYRNLDTNEVGIAWDDIWVNGIYDCKETAVLASLLDLDHHREICKRASSETITFKNIEDYFKSKSLKIKKKITLS